MRYPSFPQAVFLAGVFPAPPQYTRCWLVTTSSRVNLDSAPSCSGRGSRVPHASGGHRVDQLRPWLSRGWWDAHDAGRLDEDSLPLSEHDLNPFDEKVRMRAFGSLLQLHGRTDPYPYAAWGDTQASIDWQSFLFIRYLPRQSP